MKNQPAFLLTLSLAALFFVWQSCSKKEESGTDKYEMTWIDCVATHIDTTTWYVSTGGDDNNSGLAPGSAFRSLARAFTVVRPGGTIRIMAGTYEGGVGLRTCGSPAAPITVEGYQGIAILEGNNQAAAGIYCQGSFNMIFRNLHLRNYTDLGIGAEQSDMLVMENLEISGNGKAVQLEGWLLEGYGIHVQYSENIEIRNCLVHGNGPVQPAPPEYVTGKGIHLLGCQHVVVSGNQAYGNPGSGILVKNCQDALVENNQVQNNDAALPDGIMSGGGLWINGGETVVVNQNTMQGNAGAGLEVSNTPGQWIFGIILENNSSTENQYGIFVHGFGTTTWPDSLVLQQTNNLFTGNTIQDVLIEP